MFVTDVREYQFTNIYPSMVFTIVMKFINYSFLNFLFHSEKSGRLPNRILGGGGGLLPFKYWLTGSMHISSFTDGHLHVSPYLPVF